MQTSKAHRAAVALLAAVAVGLSGCASGDEGGDDATGDAATVNESAAGHDGHDHSHGNGESTDETPSSSADAEFAFEITDGQADPPLEQHSVDAGDVVRIVVTSDQPDEVHVHGYELSTEVRPGEPGVIEFTADQTGQFEVETHESGLVLLQLLVE